MNTNDLLGFLTQLFFLLLGAVTTINYLRYGGESRRDIALMSNSIAITCLISIVERFTGALPEWAGMFGSVALLTQPYFLLRLAQYFHEIPVWTRYLAFISMLLAGAVVIVGPSLTQATAVIVVLVMVAYFVTVNGYAMIIFFRSTWITSGVVQRRLRFAAAGSGSFAVALLMLGLQVVIPALQEWLTPVVYVAAITSAINYYVCFVPTRSLQQAWQFLELQGYLQGIGRKLIDKRLNVVDCLGELCAVANLATGGSVAAIVQKDRDTQQWRMQYATGQLEFVDRALHDSSLIDKVRQTRKPAYMRVAHPLAEADKHLLEDMQANTLLVAPVAAAEYDWGLLLVFLKRSSLFIEDDLRLVTLLAQQSAVFLENSALIEEMQHHSETLERKVEERTLEIRQMNLQLERRVAERTADLSRANAELGQVVRAKDEFLANMSHELRTPLNGILILSEILLEQIRGPINERQAKSLQTIHSSGYHLLSLINDILDLSKIEAGKLDLQLETIKIEEICNTSLQFIKEQAHKKHIRLTLQNADVHAEMEADPRRLRQILINLLSNAVKFTPHEGQVTLRTVADPDENVIQFVVEDTGIGISTEDIVRLFKPFSQLDTSLTREHEGSGLGLALVSRLVELHGGSVQIESEGILDRGSRFTVSLPRRHLPERLERSENGDGAALANLEQALYRLSSEGERVVRALIIEDSQTAAEQVERYLQELGVQIVAHASSEAAIEKALINSPDFIILDLLMPGQSGWEILSQLKANPRLESIPVMIISVVDEPMKGLAAGAAEYLVKPITRMQFRQALNRVAAELMGRKASRAAATAPAPIDLPETQGPLILLAEDNETNIQAIGEYLQDINYRVVVARNGGEALDLAIEQKPDLILMDIQMPVLDGFTVTQRLRAMSEFATTPIVALTALAMPGDRERCLAAGANEYLAKPISLKKLTGIMSQLLPEQN